ncbi:hypothetical protein ACJX0J_018384 [Zea mays]
MSSCLSCLFQFILSQVFFIGLFAVSVSIISNVLKQWSFLYFLLGFLPYFNITAAAFPIISTIFCVVESSALPTELRSETLPYIVQRTKNKCYLMKIVMHPKIDRTNKHP